MSKRHDDFNENLRDFRELSLGDYIIYVTFIS